MCAIDDLFKSLKIQVFETTCKTYAYLHLMVRSIFRSLVIYSVESSNGVIQKI